MITPTVLTSSVLAAHAACGNFMFYMPPHLKELTAAATAVNVFPAENSAEATVITVVDSSGAELERWTYAVRFEDTSRILLACNRVRILLPEEEAGVIWENRTVREGDVVTLTVAKRVVQA